MNPYSPMSFVGRECTKESIPGGGFAVVGFTDELNASACSSSCQGAEEYLHVAHLEGSQRKLATHSVSHHGNKLVLMSILPQWDDELVEYCYPHPNI
jgi:hypothetical protein